MTVTYGKPERVGHWTTVTVTSDLPGEVWFHWYRDGVHVHSGKGSTYSFFVGTAGQAEIVCIDSASPNFDELANTPDAWPATRTAFWWPSMSDDVKEYRCEYQESGGAWTSFGRVRHDAETWLYQKQTDRLTDLALYAFRIVPVDEAGNDGTPQEVESEIVVRKPDSPQWSGAFNAGTARITLSAV